MTPTTECRTTRRSLLALSLAPALALLGCGQDPAPAVAETVRPAYVVEVRSGGADALAWVGEVRALRRAELSFPVGGRVASVAVDVGDTVRAGQIVASLDLQPLKTQLAAAQADLAKAQAQVAEARLRAERVGCAQAAGATSGAETTGAQAELAAAEAALQAAMAQRDTAAWSLDQGVLRAPVDGTVAARTVEPGQTAGPGAVALSLDGAGRELSVLLPGAQRLQVGQTVTLRGSDGEAASRVLRVGGRVEAGGVRRVFLAVPDSAPVGSTWSVWLPEATTAQAARIPLRAVLPDGAAGSAGGGRVLRLAKDGRTVEQVPVRLGAQHGDSIDVVSGLAAGDRVIVAGAAGIRPGTQVKPVTFRGEVRS